MTKTEINKDAHRVRLQLRKTGRRFEVLSVENNHEFKELGMMKVEVEVGDKLAEENVILFQMNPHRFDITFERKG